MHTCLHTIKYILLILKIFKALASVKMFSHEIHVFCLTKRNLKIKLKTITILMKYDDGEEAAKNGRIL